MWKMEGSSKSTWILFKSKIVLSVKRIPVRVSI